MSKGKWAEASSPRRQNFGRRTPMEIMILDNLPEHNEPHIDAVTLVERMGAWTRGAVVNHLIYMIEEGVVDRIGTNAKYFYRRARPHL